MKDFFKIIRYTQKLWRYYAAISFFVLIISSLSLANPFFTKFVVDGIVAHLSGHAVDTNRLVLFVVLMVVFSLAATLLANLNGYLGDILSVKVNTLLSERYFKHLLRLPIGFYDNQITGKITARLERSIATIANLIQGLANNFSQIILTTVFTLVVIAIYSWPIAILLALMFPTYVWLTRKSSRAWQAKQAKINRDIDYANGRFIEAIGQIRVIKSFVTELRELNIFRTKRRSIEAKTHIQSRRWHLFDIARRGVLNIVFFMIYAIIFYQTFKHSITLGTMTLLLQLTTQAQAPLFGMSFLIDNLQRAIADSRDYFSVMGTEPTIIDQPNAQHLKISKSLIEYKNVDFSYSGSRPVLNNISFRIAPNSKVALIGESGEGKTTISNLLLRFYEPTGGKILIDGVDIKSVTQESLRENIGVVFQDPALFSGTVAENISYGQPDAGEKAMIAAAKAANAHDFILQLAKGYDSQIGERGIKLSGGQKQRIAIARAILKNPPILILDEATSSLDSKAEHEVQKALDNLMSHRTTMIIAHRLSTIAQVDTIIAIKGGRIVEIGSPVELATAGGVYAELLKLQTDMTPNIALLKKYQLAKI